RIRPRVLESLAEREFEMQAILARQIGAAERAAHREDVALRKAKRLEVREAPIAFAQRRLHVNRTTVCRHAVLEPGSGLQGVAITHPNLRLPWMSREYRFINDDRVGVVAEVGQNRRLQVQV